MLALRHAGLAAGEPGADLGLDQLAARDALIHLLEVLPDDARAAGQRAERRLDVVGDLVAACGVAGPREQPADPGERARRAVARHRLHDLGLVVLEERL